MYFWCALLTVMSWLNGVFLRSEQCTYLLAFFGADGVVHGKASTRSWGAIGLFGSFAGWLRKYFFVMWVTECVHLAINSILLWAGLYPSSSCTLSRPELTIFCTNARAWWIDRLDDRLWGSVFFFPVGTIWPLLLGAFIDVHHQFGRK